jgi:NADH dehydrogenase
MTEDPAERRRLMTIVVIGGGPTGVELAGTFAELQRHVLAKDFRRLDLGMARVILIEGSPRVLGTFPEKLSASARQQLEGLGVAVWTGTRVKDIKPGEVITETETIRAANIIWAAGVGAVPLTASLGVELDRAGRVKVGPDLSVPGHPEVFAVGDMACACDAKGANVPPLCPAAMQMGIYAAKLIAREIRNHLPPDAVAAATRTHFSYLDKGIMATIGRSRAVATSAGLQFTGMIAWMMWLFIHLLFLIGFRNKVSVMLSWTYSYFTYKRGARVIYGGGKPSGP